MKWVIKVPTESRNPYLVSARHWESHWNACLSKAKSFNTKKDCQKFIDEYNIKWRSGDLVNILPVTEKELFEARLKGI